MFFDEMKLLLIIYSSFLLMYIDKSIAVYFYEGYDYLQNSSLYDIAMYY